MVRQILCKIIIRVGGRKTTHTEIDALKEKSQTIGEYTIVHSTNCFDAISS